ncbi:MAG: NADPH:quinone oxidoreductase family protein [Proteobacteria bacterium]|nr:NADPH:quinone oxidoreductase family protein [Pseudomonadota bacterium]
MRAIVCTKIGGLQDLKIMEFAKPTLRPRGVIVKVEYAALNFPDILQPKGIYQDIPDPPFVLGLEFSGTVVEVGAECKRLKVGDRVVGMGQGAFGEYLSAREQMCFSLPAEIDFKTGASLPLSGGTALLGLQHYGRLAEGENLIVLGATGGTGLYAVQIGKALGANVIAVSSVAEKSRVAWAKFGADHVVNLSNEVLSDRIGEITSGKGGDVVYDPVGGDLFDICCKNMAMDGRLLSVGFASGKVPSLRANMALLRSIALIGVNWSGIAWHRPEISHPTMEILFDLVTTKKITPPINRVITLEDTMKALYQMDQRQSIGKTVVKVGNES